VYFRDLSYLWSIIVQAWFFATPIVYPLSIVEERLADRPTLLWLYEHNPMNVAVKIYRDLLFNLRMPSAADYLELATVAVVVLFAGWWLFDRLEGRFAEEL
jgi:ABC-2 type transport system permease protein